MNIASALSLLCALLLNCLHMGARCSVHGQDVADDTSRMLIDSGKVISHPTELFIVDSDHVVIGQSTYGPIVVVDAESGRVLRSIPTPSGIIDSAVQVINDAFSDGHTQHITLTSAFEHLSFDSIPKVIPSFARPQWIRILGHERGVLSVLTTVFIPFLSDNASLSWRVLVGVTDIDIKSGAIDDFTLLEVKGERYAQPHFGAMVDDGVWVSSYNWHQHELTGHRGLSFLSKYGADGTLSQDSILIPSEDHDASLFRHLRETPIKIQHNTIALLDSDDGTIVIADLESFASWRITMSALDSLTTTDTTAQIRYHDPVAVQDGTFEFLATITAGVKTLSTYKIICTYDNDDSNPRISLHSVRPLPISIDMGPGTRCEHHQYDPQGRPMISRLQYDGRHWYVTCQAM